MLEFLYIAYGENPVSVRLSCDNAVALLLHFAPLREGKITP